MSAIPDGPIERDPIEAYRGLTFPQVQLLLDEAVDGLPIGAYDTRILEWLKGQDQPTIITVASLLVRARAHQEEQ